MKMKKRYRVVFKDTKFSYPRQNIKEKVMKYFHATLHLSVPMYETNVSNSNSVKYEIEASRNS